MPLSAFLLILLAAFCHALWNYVLKRCGGGLPLITCTQVVGTLMYSPIAIWILVNESYQFSELHGLIMLASSAIHVAYMLLLDKAYRSGGDLSLVYPVARATGPTLTIAIALMLLNEQISTLSLVGAVIIILAAYGFSGVRAAATDVARLPSSSTKPLLLALLTGSMICAYTLVDRHAVAVLAIPAVLFYLGSIAGRLVVLIPLTLTRAPGGMTNTWRDEKRSIVTIAMLSPLSYILVLWAMKHAPVSLIAPLREVSILFAALLGAWLLKERMTPRRAACSLGMLTGVVFIAMR